MTDLKVKSQNRINNMFKIACDMADKYNELEEKYLNKNSKFDTLLLITKSQVITSFFRLKGLIALHMELFEEDIQLPEEYSEFHKLAIDTLLLSKEGNLVTSEGLLLSTLFDSIEKSAKIGDSAKDKK